MWPGIDKNVCASPVRCYADKKRVPMLCWEHLHNDLNILTGQCKPPASIPNLDYPAHFRIRCINMSARNKAQAFSTVMDLSQMLQLQDEEVP
jgi:hypothetical protein